MINEVISEVKPIAVYKITDLIPEQTLELLLKGLSEKGTALVVEEKSENRIINRVPLPKETVKTYWTPICEYFDHFPNGRHECINDTKERAGEIIEKNISDPRVDVCHLGVSVIAIPFYFKGRVIGVLFGGKKRVKGSNIRERLNKFIEKHPSIKNEKSIGEEDVKCKSEKFDYAKAVKIINTIPEISKEEFQEEQKKLKVAADFIFKVGRDNYLAKSRLLNEQFLFDIIEYFINVYSAGKIPIKDILQKIINAITQFAKVKYSIFIWGNNYFIKSFDEDGIALTAIDNKIGDIENIVKTRFKKDKDVFYFLTEDSEDVNDIEINSFFKITSFRSIYARSITFRDSSKGFFIFVDPEGEKNTFSSDCVEFLNLVADRIKSQINIYLADEAKSEFIAEMTHRLKSPMQNIMDQSGYLEEYLKKEHPDDSRGVSIAHEIIDGVAHFDHQIKSHSYIATIDKEGGWSYDFQFHPIITLVKKCVRRFRPRAWNREIKIITLFPEDFMRKKVEFDWDTMDIAVSNLLDNAVKYSHFRRDIFTEVSFDDNKKECCMSISNRGLGIDPDEYEKIFEKYYRSRSIVDPIRWIAGTGIGLSVVDRIVIAHKGKRMVTSKLLKEKKKGDVYLTTFKIFLPYDTIEKEVVYEENIIY